MRNKNSFNTSDIPYTTIGATPWSGVAEISLGLTDLQQCIRDCLRLATMAEWGPANKIEELARLQKLIEAQVQKELDAWKALMGGETSPNYLGATDINAWTNKS